MRDAARRLRQNPTLAEKYRWDALRRRQLDGFRFRRQHRIGWYIVDFFCWETGVVVEIDGAVHGTAEQSVRDRLRDENLRSFGYHILHMTNAEVFDDIEAV